MMVAMRARPHMGTNCVLVSANMESERSSVYLDEEVGDQGSKECSNGNVNILSKDNALGLDNEEVDKLLDIVQETLQRCFGDGEVLARPELGGETLSKSELSSNLGRSSGTEHNPTQLEDPADYVQVTSGEDEEDGGGERDAGCAGVLPAQETVEHAVVVCRVSAQPVNMTIAATALTGEVLAGSGLLLGDLLGVGEVCELIARLRSLCLCLLGHGS